MANVFKPKYQLVGFRVDYKRRRDYSYIKSKSFTEEEPAVEFASELCDKGYEVRIRKVEEAPF